MVVVKLVFRCCGFMLFDSMVNSCRLVVVIVCFSEVLLLMVILLKLWLCSSCRDGRFNGNFWLGY